MEKYLTDDVPPTADVLRACIRKGVIASAFNPVLCGSSYKNKGVQQVLDAVVDYMPAPTDVAGHQDGGRGRQPDRRAQDARTTSRSAGLAFKVINDAYGALTFVRVYSGVLTKGMSVTNTTRGKREKIGRMVEMFAEKQNPIEEARAGDIIALVSLAETDTGDTLCDTDHQVVLERMRFPDPGDQRVGEGQAQGRSRRSSARRWARWFVPIPRCIWKRIARRTKPFCAAWASCTSK